jgi:hypothetical protein
MGATASSEASQANKGESHLSYNDAISMPCDHREFILQSNLDAGLDPSSYRDGLSLLYRYSDSASCVQLLLERGADPNQPYNQSFPKHSILFNLLNDERTDSLEVLVKYGFDVHAKSAITGNKLINDALALCIFSFPCYTELLFELGADINAVIFEDEPFAESMILTVDPGDLPVKCFEKYRPRFGYSKKLKQFPSLYRMWVRRKWMLVKCSVRFLSLHQRAVVTANHPDRLREIGVFSVECE